MYEYNPATYWLDEDEQVSNRSDWDSECTDGAIVVFGVLCYVASGMLG